MDSIILQSFIPEIFLSICILFQLLFNAHLITNIKNNSPIISNENANQTFFTLLCLLLLCTNNKVEGFFPNFIFITDSSTYFLKNLIVISSLFILFVVLRDFILQKLNFFEYFTIFLLSLFALLLLVSSGDMISAYLVIELQALAFYILSSFRRDSTFSTEAGLKYFIAGSFISGIFLFGCSLIYGALGTLNFNHLKLLLNFNLVSEFYTLNSFVLFGVLLITITFLFKLAAAPFHFWAPDVYDGSPIASTAIFSIIPKFGIVAFLIKWLSVVYGAFPEIYSLLLCSGLASVFVGTFFAMQQKRLKRLLIYSSIAQTGFIVVGLSCININNLVSIYFFIFIYVITSILIWNNLSLLYSFQNKINSFYTNQVSPLYLSSLSNFFKVNKLWAISFVIIFFSIAGIPPLSGFISKVLILFSLIENRDIFSPFIIVMLSAVSSFYYLRIVKSVLFESNDSKFKNENSQIIFNNLSFYIDCLSVSFLLFLLFFFFFYPSKILLICNFMVVGSFFY